MIKIKICGLFREEDAAYANEAKPDYAGFVFAESRRKVSPALAARLRRLLDSDIVPVGVFVNASLGDITALYRDGIIDIVQLHGDEDAAYIARLREAGAKGGRGAPPLIKAFSMAKAPAGTGDLALSANLVPLGADYYLVSVHKAGYFADRPRTLVRCIFSPKGCENANFKEVADLQSESIMCLHYRQTLITKKNGIRRRGVYRCHAEAPVSLKRQDLCLICEAFSLLRLLPVCNL
jgi:hypothetical protein